MLYLFILHTIYIGIVISKPKIIIIIFFLFQNTLQSLFMRGLKITIIIKNDGKNNVFPCKVPSGSVPIFVIYIRNIEYNTLKIVTNIGLFLVNSLFSFMTYHPLHYESVYFTNKYQLYAVSSVQSFAHFVKVSPKKLVIRDSNSPTQSDRLNPAIDATPPIVKSDKVIINEPCIDKYLPEKFFKSVVIAGNTLSATFISVFGTKSEMSDKAPAIVFAISVAAVQ